MSLSIQHLLNAVLALPHDDHLVFAESLIAS